MKHLRTAARSGAAALALAGAAACSDDLTSINQNPNSPTTAPNGPVFTNAVRLGAARWLGTAYSLRGTELVAQHLAEVQYPQSDQYVRLQANSTSGFQDDPYAGELKDLNSVMNNGLAANQPGIYGPAMALRTWGFAYVTDTFGDVPYRGALQGDSAAANVTPAYDAQKDIYADFFARLDKVSKDLAAPPAGAATLGSADPLYAGNFLRWQRFANSLRARLAMRLANVDPATARAEFQAAVAAPGGLFAANTDNAVLRWPGDGVYDNPWSVNFRDRDDHRISDRLMQVFAATQDPRVSVLAQRAPRDTTSPRIFKYCTTAAPCYAGLQNALSQDEALSHVSYTSRPGLIFYPARTTYGVSGGTGAAQPSYLLTYAEVSFLKAEAAERGWIAGSAAQFYQDGIRASMAQWGVGDAATAAFLAGPAGTYAGGAAGLKQIAVQKWVALFGDGGQAWAEFRRTCQPALVRPGPTAILPEIPRRFQYSVNERLTNNANLGAAVSRQGADQLLTRMYWDTKPEAAPTFEPGCGKR